MGINFWSILVIYVIKSHTVTQAQISLNFSKRVSSGAFGCLNVPRMAICCQNVYSALLLWCQKAGCLERITKLIDNISSKVFFSWIRWHILPTWALYKLSNVCEASNSNSPKYSHVLQKKTKDCHWQIEPNIFKINSNNFSI